MANNHLLNIQDFLRKEGVLISFTGKFSQNIIEELGEALKKYLEEEQRPQNSIFNIFSIFIEQTQNIKNYCTIKQSNPNFDRISSSCIVTIGKVDDVHYVYSGNLVENYEVDSLLSKIDFLKNLSRDELKALFKEKRKEAIDFENGSAGLGFIDISRKASSPLEYSITPIDDSFSFFTLKVYV